MHITDEAEAWTYFKELVQHAVETTDLNEDEAEAVVKENLGYYAGYFSNDVRVRVERLYNCIHPFFGSIEKNGPPSAEAAFQMGIALGQSKLSRLDQPKNPKRKSVWERIRADNLIPQPKSRSGLSRS